VLEVHRAAIIRNGPSLTADVIGTASPGAQFHLKAREDGWIQFVDPASGNTGWIESKRVAKPGSPQGLSAENSSSLPIEKPKPAKKQVKKQTKSPEFAKQRPSGRVPPVRDRAYAELHEDDVFIADRSLRRNGPLARRRMLREGLMSPDFIPPQ
jgi:hypothetical protein